MNSEVIDILKTKRLCYHCIGESFLSSEVQQHGIRRKCAYCHKTLKTFNLEQIAERVDSAFDTHFVRTSNQPTGWQISLVCDKESNYEWDRDGEPVVYAIMNAADIPEEAARDIQLILQDKYNDYDMAVMGEETEYASESYYEGTAQSDTEWQELWYSFERLLKTESRYFSQKAAQALSYIFDCIEALHAHDGRPLIVDAGPDTHFSSFYRARVFQSEQKLLEALKLPDRTLGPPPSEIATAGRMNAHGISVFYGATDPAAAIAEVRPPVGSSVAVAQFEIIKPLRLLDLSALEKVYPPGSIFDPAYGGIIRRAMFLRSLCQKMIRPVMPNDEPLEYLATQAVADFLATKTSISLDGILFPSVQAAGNMLNVVLFNKASKIEPVILPPGTEIKVEDSYQDDEGWHRDYSVTEFTPESNDIEPTKPVQRTPSFEFETLTQDPWDLAPLNPTIRINMESINIHIVQRALYETEIYKVSRRRYPKHILDLDWMV